MNIRRRSIFFKLFISFIIVLIPIFAWSMLYYSWNKNQKEQEIKSVAQSSVEYMLSTFESEISRITDLQFGIINNKDIRKYRLNEKYYGPYEKSELINRIKDILDIVKNSNVYIEDIELLLPKNQFKITSNEGVLKWNEKEFTEFIETKEVLPMVIVNDTECIYSIMYMPMNRRKNKNDIKMVIRIKFNKDMLIKYLNQSKSNYERTAFLYSYTNNEFICSDDRFNGVSDLEIQKIAQTTKDKDKYCNIVSIENKDYYLIGHYSQTTDNSLIILISLADMLSGMIKYKIYLFLLLLISITVVFIYVRFTYNTIITPIHIIIESYKKLEKGDLNVQITNTVETYEFHQFFKSFNKMVKRLNNLIEKTYLQELYTQKIELKQLQMQVDPHFMYNSYFILHRMIKSGDNENASMYSSYIGEYFKYITRNAKDLITLKDEIKHIENYIKIQMICFSGRIKIQMEDLPIKYSQCKIPRMIFQPVLENAIKYGIKNRQDSNGILSIRFVDSEEILHVIIDDNGDSISDDKIIELNDYLASDKLNELEVTGMINVHRRLRISCGKKSGIHLERSQLGGLRVNMYIHNAEIKN